MWWLFPKHPMKSISGKILMFLISTSRMRTSNALTSLKKGSGWSIPALPPAGKNKKPLPYRRDRIKPGCAIRHPPSTIRHLSSAIRHPLSVIRHPLMGAGIEGYHTFERHKNKLQVHREGSVFNVLKVTFQTLVHLSDTKCTSTKSRGLGESRQPRFYRKTCVQIGECGVPVGVFANRVGAWSYKAHISFQNIEELWDLIKVGLPEKLTEPKDPAVILLGDIRLAYRLFIILGMHGPE